MRAAYPHRGFSLIEVLMVVGLMAIALALFSGVVGGGLDGMRLRNAAKEVAAQLRYARSMAIASGEATAFSLDVDSAHWTTGRREGDLAGKPTLEVMTAAQEQVEAGVARIRFFPDGSSTGANITLSKGSARWLVEVRWLTGEVRLSRGSATP